MTEDIKDIYELADEVINDVNSFQEKYTTETGKTVISEDMICALDSIVRKGLMLREKVVKTKFYEGKAAITVDVVEMEKYIDALQMTEKNAKKLDIRSAVDSWNAIKLISAKLGCDVLDYRDSLN